MKVLKAIGAVVAAFFAVSCDDATLIDASEFSINREGTLFIPFGASRSLELTADDIEEFHVMNQPYGWSASIEGTTLTVTAPAKQAYSLGAAVLEGEVSIHATSDVGSCKVAKLSVEAGEGLTVSIDGEGNAIVRNANTIVNGGGNLEFAPFAIGVMKAEQWYDFERFMSDTFENAWNTYGTQLYNQFAVHYSYYELSGKKKAKFVDGEYEIDEVIVNINELYKTYMVSDESQDIPKGTYAVFALPVDSKYKMAGDPVDAVYSLSSFSWGEPEYVALSNDVTVNVNAEGADSYLIGVCPAYRYQYIALPRFDSYMKMANEGPWELFNKRGVTYYMGKQVTAAPSSFSVREILGESLLYDEIYHVWVMPMYSYMAKTVSGADGAAAYDYSAYDFNTHFWPYTMEVRTLPLSDGGPDIQMTEGVSGYDTVSADITLSEGETAYYGVFTKAEFDAFDQDDAAMKAAIKKKMLEEILIPGLPSPVLTISGNVSSKVSFCSTDTYYLIAFVVSADGKAGYCDWVEVSPKSVLNYDENITVQLTSIEEDGEYYKATFSVDGATKIALYNLTDTPANAINTDRAVKALATGSGSVLHSMVMADVTDRQVTVSFVRNELKEDIFVWAYTVDDDGVLGKIIKEPAVFNISTELAK